MRIALLAPPYLSVPPKGYGGTEKIVSLLAEGLVDLGHEVTLFATGDSQTRAKLDSIFPEGLGNSGLEKNNILLPLLHYTHCFKRQKDFDMIHNHAQFYAMPLAELSKTPVVHTLHGTLYAGEISPDKQKTVAMFGHQNFVSISNNQRLGFPELNYIKTVYNGLELSEYSYIEKPKGDYLLWVGRITPKKGPLPAIEVARKLGRPVVLAAAIDPADQSYFDHEIKPFIDGKNVNFIGELSHTGLNSIYGNAYVTLFPVSWHEPFGLVMIESMATGTPVVAYNIGSVPEVIKEGKTGFIVDPKQGVDGLVHAVKRIDSIQRGDCRTHVVDHFSKEMMVKGYVEAYEKILSSV
ncbi:hypothetical protein A3D77_03340 [Candidatus Gottesmanbacteria bacterium RIFCSPHIGHO2_02_FULL_39_11]|uniref:Glycosyl transferase n=1 Tax=Candidatus Gottesmanbacteria bacterium RIFCSPHIGHO2_02_FULL_39_11 TaxID=1798382 RepID=A0A1F5ZNP2_9BACT|nr:MAG: hypothetical protein A3D77_03340 [Candidatus Gottesmanbacteria bacterium RIFCSPHIGHO2_02_FULL_39_11]